MSISEEMAKPSTGSGIAAGTVQGTKKTYKFVPTDSTNLPQHTAEFFTAVGMANGQDPKHAPLDLVDKPERIVQPSAPSNI